MRAFTLDEFDAQPALREDLPPPEPRDGELLVRVAASSVNPVDNAIAGGMLRGMAEYDFPVVLGRDFAGTVAGTGAGVSRFGEGDEVLGFVIHANPNVGAGSWAELIAIAEDSFIAAKPGGVDMPEAGAAALAGVTALASIDALRPTTSRRTPRRCGRVVAGRRPCRPPGTGPDGRT